MANHCIRGKANPTQTTKYRLWADSAGYCQNPSCKRTLFVDLETGGAVHFGEIAHIIAARPNGARGNEHAAPEALGLWDNLVLLCANCHTVIDKAPKEFPVDLLLSWKDGRQSAVESALGIAAFPTRAAARSAIEPYTTQNRYIHRTIGPDNEYRFDPEAEEAAMWQHEVEATIIPNHHRILRIIDANARLLSHEEKVTVAAYRSHVKGMTYRHQGEGGLKTVRYPKEMEFLFADR